jgi:serine/threonine protein kinase
MKSVRVDIIGYGAYGRVIAVTSPAEIDRLAKLIEKLSRGTYRDRRFVVKDINLTKNLFESYNEIVMNEAMGMKFDFIVPVIEWRIKFLHRTQSHILDSSKPLLPMLKGSNHKEQLLWLLDHRSRFTVEGFVLTYPRCDGSVRDFYEAPLETKFQICKDVAFALSLLHENNYSHGDIHAGNILYRKVDGETRIALHDVGMANSPPDYENDIVLFGAFCYDLLLGQFHYGVNYLEVSNIERYRAKLKEVCGEVMAEIVHVCLEEEEDKFKTMTQVYRLLLRF